MMMTRLASRPDNPGAWLAVEALARLAAPSARIVLPTWHQDSVELDLREKRIAATIGATVDAVSDLVSPCGDDGPIILDVGGQLICLDWHCKPARSLTGRPRVQLLAGQLTLAKHLQRLASTIAAKELSAIESCLDTADDRGIWLTDARAVWTANDVGYSPHVADELPRGSAIVELLAMLGLALAQYELVGAALRYRVEGRYLYAPLVRRGSIKGLGWAQSSMSAEDKDDD